MLEVIQAAGAKNGQDHQCAGGEPKSMNGNISCNGGSTQTEDGTYSRCIGRPLSLVEIRRREGFSEFFLTFRPAQSPSGAVEPAADLYRRVADCVASLRAEVLQERCYGATNAYRKTAAFRT